MSKRDQLVDYLKSPRHEIHAKYISHKSIKNDVEIEIDVDVDLPQRPVFKIQKTERVKITIKATNEAPEVFILRNDFPDVPHLSIWEHAFPRKICLYERPWSEEKANWGPGLFIERIRAWLSGTADGSLHRLDQPLEPFIFPTINKLILPDIEPLPILDAWISSYYSIAKIISDNRIYVTLSKECNAPNASKWPVIFIKCAAHVHGIINKTPKSIKELNELIINHIKSPVSEIIKSLISPHANEISGERNKHKKLLLVLILPKLRKAGELHENLEYQAFGLLPEKDELTSQYHIHADTFGHHGVKYLHKASDSSKINKITIIPLSVSFNITPPIAAKMNGVKQVKSNVVAIGVGALGSQVVNNLIRGGFGSWTFIDPDIFEPHNIARHTLSAESIGQYKADALANFLHFNGEKATTTLHCDYLNPQKELIEELNNSLKSAQLIFDFSASVSVSRTLGLDLRTNAKCISAFLSPKGENLIVLAEDPKRIHNLLWLESEYIRAIAYNPDLEKHFPDVTESAHRYGNGCRDLTATLPQDSISLFSGILSQKIRQIEGNDHASISIFKFNKESLSLKTIEVSVSPPIKTNLLTWSVSIHEEVKKQLIHERQKHLPNETGGVLVGIVDRDLRVLSILGAITAPSDSQSWPSSFIRGKNNLKDKIESLTKTTYGNMIYVGEWHSHPNGHNATPSATDRKALEEITPHMSADGIPAIMLIIGEADDLQLVK